MDGTQSLTKLTHLVGWQLALLSVHFKKSFQGCMLATKCRKCVGDKEENKAALFVCRCVSNWYPDVLFRLSFIVVILLGNVDYLFIPVWSPPGTQGAAALNFRSVAVLAEVGISLSPEGSFPAFSDL